ncbi:MAG: 5-formyltetrahydrofolate cyclo-ligase [Syntrophales bacterium]
MLDAEKKKIRREILALRNALPQAELAAMSKSICQRFMNLPMLEDCRAVMIFLSFGSEVNTDGIIDELWRRGKKVYVPLCKPETREMVIFPITSFADVEPGYFGIREPRQDLQPPVSKSLLDMVVVPAVAFDLRGFRVGYGGGYYDRFLVGMDVPKLGLAFSCQLIPEAPVGDYDLPVQSVITEKGRFEVLV